MTWGKKEMKKFEGTKQTATPRATQGGQIEAIISSRISGQSHS